MSAFLRHDRKHPLKQICFLRLTHRQQGLDESEWGRYPRSPIKTMRSYPAER